MSVAQPPCMLRITPRAGSGGTTLEVEGRLVGPWVVELRQAALDAARAGRVDLDLAAVSYATAEGAALLRELESHGCRLVRRSTFLETLLRPTP